MAEFTVPIKKEAQAQPTDKAETTSTATNQGSGTNPTTGNSTTSQAPQKPVKPSQQDDLIALASKDFVLFHTPDKEPYAKVVINNCRMVMHLRSDEFKKLLGFLYHLNHHKVAHRQGLDDAIQLLIGKAIFEGAEEEVFIRTAPYHGNIIVDLSNDQGQAVEISQSGWKIITNPPVNFIGLQSQRPIPLPLMGGKLEDFNPFINTETDEDFIMIMAFLIFTLTPRGPFPVLVLNGSGGSCKSTGAHMIKSIVDPSSAVNFSQPKNIQDVFVNASKTWLVTYDNLSEIKKWFSDCLCQVATGGSHGAKKLYTDADEFQIVVKRPIIISGIGDLITRGDLASRAIVVRLKDIKDTPAMKTDAQIWEQFALKQPYLLGWILGAMSAGLRNLYLINENYPRMADFSRFLAAVDREIWATGTFNKAYRSNISRVVKQVIQADPVTSSVIALMQNQTDCKGTAAEALNALGSFIHDKRILLSRDWPQAPNKLKGFLDRSKNLLKEEGIEIQYDIYENGRKLMRIYKSDVPVLDTIAAPVIDDAEPVIEIDHYPAKPQLEDLSVGGPSSKREIFSDEELAEWESKLTPEERAGMYQSIFDK